MQFRRPGFAGALFFQTSRSWGGRAGAAYQPDGGTIEIDGVPVTIPSAQAAIKAPCGH